MESPKQLDSGDWYFPVMALPKATCSIHGADEEREEGGHANVPVGHRFCTQAKKKANEPRQIPSPIQLPKAFSMQQGGDKDAVMRRRQGQGTGVAAGLLCNQTSHVLRAHCISPLFCWLVEVIHQFSGAKLQGEAGGDASNNMRLSFGMDSTVLKPLLGTEDRSNHCGGDERILHLSLKLAKGPSFCRREIIQCCCCLSYWCLNSAQIAFNNWSQVEIK